MNNRTALSVVILTALLTILTALSTAPQSCYAQALPKSESALTDEEALNIIKKLWDNKSAIESWRNNVEECVTNDEHDEFTKTTSLAHLSPSRRDIINNFDSLAVIYRNDFRRASLYNFARKNGINNVVLKMELFQMFQEALLLQQATFNVHCKLRKDNLEKIFMNNKFAKGYNLFLYNSGIDVLKDYNPKEGALKVFTKIEKDIKDRCNLYRSFLVTITQDLQSIVEDIKLADTTIKDLTKELDDIKKENEYLRLKLRTKFQAELQDKIEQILLAGKGTVAIPISGQTVRFVYVSPGKYYIGNDEELNKKLTELSGHSMRKYGMNEITIKSGFFIMEDKITPEQLQAFTNKEFQVPNGLTWKQAMEAANKANLSLSLILNGMTVRLPTEIEWECAVRGKESKNLFPWGNENPDKNPDDDVTALGIKHAASIFSEWCIDKKMDNYYGFDGTVDMRKAVTYFPNSNPPYFTYYCIGDTKEHRTVIDHDTRSPSLSFRVYKGASDEDISKKNYHNRAISMQRSISDDVSNPNVSFRFVLIPYSDSIYRPISTTKKAAVPIAHRSPYLDNKLDAPIRINSPTAATTFLAPRTPVKVTINGEVFTFVKCPKCESFEMPINFIRSYEESIGQDYYIMDTELTVAQYEALRALNPDLPSLDILNKNCNASERNSSLPPYKNKPLHGVVPLEDKSSSSGLRYANMICETLTSALNSGKAEFDKSISGSKKVRLPSSTEWYYAAAAVDDPRDVKNYCHLGTIRGRDYMKQDCLSMLLNSQSASSLESIQTTYMKKYWKMLWEESELSSDEFNASPNQVILMIQNKDNLKLSDPNEKIDDIVKLMPLTFFRCLLYNIPMKNSDYLFESAFTAVKSGEEPNNWGLYDVHSNVSELVLDSDRPAGYSIMGGQNNLSLDSGWQDNWQRYLLWKKISPGEVDQYTMPGVRLIFTVE